MGALYITYGKVPAKTYLQSKGDDAKLKHVVTIHEHEHNDHVEIIKSIEQTVAEHNGNKEMASQIKKEALAAWPDKGMILDVVLKG